MQPNVVMTNDESALKPVGAPVDKTVSNTAVALVTAAQVPAQARYARITNGAGGGVMLRFDAEDPTSSTGAYVAAGGVKWLPSACAAAVRAIRQGSSDSIVDVSFWA